MTVIVKSTTSPLTVPDAVRQQAGFKIGQVLEFKASGGVVTIIPKLPMADAVDEMLASLKAVPESKPRQKKPRSR
jgi:bifunctional DNA-binding transcriptional regulator/antitoxin component of YhaV-PrlF toxin-antitoxin module